MNENKTLIQKAEELSSNNLEKIKVDRISNLLEIKKDLYRKLQNVDLEICRVESCESYNEIYDERLRKYSEYENNPSTNVCRG